MRQLDLEGEDYYEEDFLGQDQLQPDTQDGSPFKQYLPHDPDDYDQDEFELIQSG